MFADRKFTEIRMLRVRLILSVRNSYINIRVCCVNLKGYKWFLNYSELDYCFKPPKKKSHI